jgi:hypothetical protein
MMMEVIILPKRRFLQEPRGVTSQKMAFSTVTTMNISNLYTDVNAWLGRGHPYRFPFCHC